MSVRIRLARGGAKKRPVYFVVVADSRSPRDGKFLEKIGRYNPLLPNDHEERVIIDADRLSYWISVGAQPSDRVAKLLEAMKLRKYPKKFNPKKGKILDVPRVFDPNKLNKNDDALKTSLFYKSDEHH